jgi:hypothetical protein
MTRRRLRVLVLGVGAFYVLALAVGVALRMPFEAEATGRYATYKDLLPLVIAIPAAYLAYAFQRRGSYLQALRGLWSHMVSAVSAALAYTECPEPTEERYAAVLTGLGVAIEEVRSVFQDVPTRAAAEGWYPFEPVKQIYEEVKRLGFGGSATAARREAARASIYELWKRSRSRLLSEFDREVPSRQQADFAPPADLPS